MNEHLAAIGSVAARRHGLITRTEIAALGVTESRIRTLRRHGVIDAAGRGVYRVTGAPQTVRQRVLSACLEVGGVASHRTAAALHGLDGFTLQGQLEVLVRDGRSNPRSDLARVHTTTWLPSDDLVTVDGIPALGVARTLFSLAALVPELARERVAEAVDEAICIGIAADAWLWWRLERLRCRGRNGVTVFEQILSERSSGAITESWLERETLRILDDAGLPHPLCQARISPQGAFVARVDFLYEAPRAVIEVSGYQWHRTRAQTTADARRRRRLTLAGYQVHEFTYDEVVRTPERLVETVCAVLDRPIPTSPPGSGLLRP